MAMTRSRWSRIGVGVGAIGLVAGTMPAVAASSRPLHASHRTQTVTIASGALKPGSIKHVWLIILENKSYDETFTGLNQNTYLWTTLPQQGALLTKLLRYRALQHGQLYLVGVRSGPVVWGAGRLRD